MDEEPKQYRRDLNAKPREVISESTPLLQWFNLLPAHYKTWCYVIVGIVGIYTLYKLNDLRVRHSVYSSIVAIQNSTGSVPVSGPERHPQAIMVMELLRMYGFTPKFIGDTDPRSPYVFITVAGGKRITTPELLAQIPNMKLYNFHPGATSPVVLYGVEGCLYSQKARDMLDARGISYQYVNLNEDAVVSSGITSARFVASGHSIDGLRNPYLEYKGKMYDNPELYKVIESGK